MADDPITDFELVWKMFPRKTAKAVARKAWNKLKPDTATVQKMIDALKWQSKTRQWREGRIPHMSTWIHQERWTDEPWEPQPKATPADQQRTKTQEMLRLMEQGVSLREAENKVFH